MLGDEIVTKKDLEQFRRELLTDLKDWLSNRPRTDEKKYLRSKEVRKLLDNISPGTLQSLRISGALHPKKVGGTLYYDAAEIEELLKKGTGQ